ncbi:hypothetical protein [Companilactobacillus sp. HBUAS56275]|uniref:hypothetical protein n=1 Tax=Companilactobacillus sp. HBUAS56275 TaxID=3109364 RepID=UPI002FEEE1D0
MSELKIGGNDVVKIMYGDREIGGGHKSGDIVFSASSNYDTIRQYTAPYKPSKDDEYTIRIIYKNGYQTYVLKDVDATPDNISNLEFVSSNFKFAINSNGELSVRISDSTSFIVVVILK